MPVRSVVLTGLLTLGSLSIGCAGRETARPPGAEPALPASSTCDATRAQFAIAERVSTALVERARIAAHAGSVRVIRPSDAVTMDFSDSRLNVHLDEKDIVRSLRCG